MKGSFVLYLVLLGIVLAGLFYSSSQPYEKQDLRQDIARWVDLQQAKQLLGGISFTYGKKEISVQSVGVAGLIEFFIRKAAHFLTFALLAFLIFQVFASWTSVWTALPWSGFLTLALAVLDEWHQSFTDGRTPLLHDVMLDGLGICLMLLILGILNKLQPKRK